MKRSDLILANRERFFKPGRGDVMAKRKKYPKLPNGFGSIKYLGKGRRNPYAVHPPTKEFTLDGVPKTPKAICYVSDWMIGFGVLTAYHAGTYYPGYERTLAAAVSGSPDQIAQAILADYNATKAAGCKIGNKPKTFKDVYNDFFHWKYEEEQSRQYSQATIKCTKAAFSNCTDLHDKAFAELRYQDLQSMVDRCPLKYSSKSLIVSLFHQMYAYADTCDLIDKDYSAHVRVRTADDNEHGVPFSDRELDILWANKNNDIVKCILVMCYSGFRIKEIETITVFLEERYMHGGVKTAAGKNRDVPIHSAIYPLVEELYHKNGSNLLGATDETFRNRLYPVLKSLGIATAPSGEKHTPHDCRHTFSALCERYGVRENDRKRMMGHSFGSDITNQVYGHRTIEDLRTEIEKIKA